MERRYTKEHESAIEFREDTGTYTLSGLAAVFYNPSDAGTEHVLWNRPQGRAVERISPTAFDRAIAQAAEEGVMCLFNHDKNWILGKAGAGLELSKERRGLRYRCPLNMKNPQHVTVAENVKDKLLTGSSFGFVVDPEGERWTYENGTEVRHIDNLKLLLDASPVTYPAFTATNVGLRSDDGIDEAVKSYLRWHTAAAIEKMKLLKNR
jgi:HK97 family phage prohead protease